MSKLGDAIKKGLADKEAIENQTKAFNDARTAKINKSKQDYQDALVKVVRPAFKEILNDFKENLNCSGQKIIASKGLPAKYRFTITEGYTFEIKQRTPLFIFVYNNMDAIYLHIACHTRKNMLYDKEIVLEYDTAKESDITDAVTEAYTEIIK